MDYRDYAAVLPGDEKARNRAIKEIMGQCLSWMADDIKLQTARISAMRQASSIIEMKLRYTLGDSNDGKIIFVDSSRGDQVTKDEQTGALWLYREETADGARPCF